VVAQLDSREVPPALQRGNCYATTDTAVLNGMKREWKFTISGGDMATVESYLVIRKGDSTVFKSGIVLDGKNEGLQHEQFGWAAPLKGVSLSKWCVKFNRVAEPMVFL
jgi:hypothetical protein